MAVVYCAPLNESMAAPKKKNKKGAGIALKLSEGEQDLLSHLEAGYQLETDSLGPQSSFALRKRRRSSASSVRQSKHDQDAARARANKPSKRTRSTHHCLASTRHPATDPMNSREMQHKFPGDMQGFWLQLSAILGHLTTQNPADIDQ